MPSRLLELFAGANGDITISSVILRLALVFGCVFAIVHLISLWGTRYGDNNTMQKSLFLSIVLHGCLGLGWATVAQYYPKTGTIAVQAATPTPILFVQDVDSAPRAGTNDLPIFHAGPANNIPPTRESRILGRTADDQSSPVIEDPQVNQNPPTEDMRDVPDFSSQFQESMPELARPSQDATRSSVSGSSQFETPIVPEIKPRNVTRSNVSRKGQNALDAESFDAPGSPAMKRGATNQLGEILKEGASISLPSDFASDAPAKPLGPPSNESMRRPESPSPSPFDDGEAGSRAESNEGNPRTISNKRRADRVGKKETRVNDSHDDFHVEGLPSRSRTSSGNPQQSNDAISSEDRALSSRPSDESDTLLPQADLTRPTSNSGSKAPARAPDTYRARSLGQRMSNVLRNGGSEESELAVENSLKWLIHIQESDGHWSGSKYGAGAEQVDPQNHPRPGGGTFADSGISALVILSFLGAGYTHEKGPYTVEIRRALEWMVDQQTKNGYLGGEAKEYDQNYCHAMATFALAEANAMQVEEAEFPELSIAVRKAVALICSMQNPDGGWRYQRNGESDMSMFGWQVMALKSATNGGISVPEKTRIGMVRFLNSHGQGEYGGLAGYKKGDKPTPAMTAEALFCRQLFSVRSNDPAAKEAVNHLRKYLPNIRDPNDYDEYYWYYGTLAMRNQDESSWRAWNNALRDQLISLQIKQGKFAGSWDPNGKWAKIGGRLYSTSLNTMCLEAYYRYQSNNKSSDAP